jgi:hypothetical protein
MTRFTSDGFVCNRKMSVMAMLQQLMNLRSARVHFVLAITRQRASHLQFLKGQEICQIAFGMYDLQINWGDGGLSCAGRVIYAPNAGGEVVWTEGHPFDAVPVLRLLQQAIEAFDNSSEGELKLQFSNGDRLTVSRADGPEGFTIHQPGQPLIVG